MKRNVMMLVMGIVALVLTTVPQVAYAGEGEKNSTSCTLSFVDVYCAQNPEECQQNSALKDTSIHGDFAFAYPKAQAHQSFASNFSQSNSSSLFGPDMDAEKLFQLVNSYRASIGLAEFEKHPELCAVAQSRGPELEGEIRTGNIHGGMRARNMSHITENMKWGVSEEEVLSWWLNSPIHASAIHGSSQYACTQCSGPVCIMLFADFVGENDKVVARGDGGA